MKFEVRSSKSEVKPNSEVRKGSGSGSFRFSRFGFLSGFELRNSILPALLFLLAARPASSFACAACYGASDSPLAEGMNWGILSLLAVVGLVLGSVGTFFVFLAKKSASAAATTPAAPEQNNSDSEEHDGKV
jgi:hypothetical protein